MTSFDESRKERKERNLYLLENIGHDTHYAYANIYSNLKKWQRLVDIFQEFFRIARIALASLPTTFD